MRQKALTVQKARFLELSVVGPLRTERRGVWSNFSHFRSFCCNLGLALAHMLDAMQVVWGE